MDINKLWMPVQREIWEHRRAFFGVFLFLASAILLVTLWSLFKSDGFNLVINGENTDITFKRDWSENTDYVDKDLNQSFSVFITILLYLFAFLSTYVSVYYWLGCLYDERKDRSILFWKSMPVSEWQSILTKFFTGLLLIPLIALVVALILGFVLTLILSFWLPSVIGVSFFDVWSNVSLLSSFFDVLLTVIVAGIWLAPFAAWLMLASAYSSRSPIMVAVMPPLLIVVTEMFLTGESTLLAMLDIYMPDLNYFEGYFDYSSSDASVSVFEAFLSGPRMPVIIVLTSGFLFVSHWLRSYRFEL